MKAREVAQKRLENSIGLLLGLFLELLENAYGSFFCLKLFFEWIEIDLLIAQVLVWTSMIFRTLCFGPVGLWKNELSII